MTPYEATILGFVSPTGGTIPYYDPSSGAPLTADQILAGATEAATGEEGRGKELRKLGKVGTRLAKVEGRKERRGAGPERERKIENLTKRRNYLLTKFGVA
jgi:hypothetical protein